MTDTERQEPAAAEPIGFYVLFRLPEAKLWRSDWYGNFERREAADVAADEAREAGYEAVVCALIPVR